MLDRQLLMFFDWAGETEQQYSKSGMLPEREIEEWEYPLWNQLIEETEILLRKMEKGKLTEEQLHGICVAIALDHEREELLDFCKYELTEKSKIDFAIYGRKSQQPQCRWQIAALLETCNQNPIAIEILRGLTRDSDIYVRKRAQNAITMI